MVAHLCVIHHEEDRSGVPAGPTTILLNHVFLFLFIVVSCCPFSMATELCTNPEFRHQDVRDGRAGSYESPPFSICMIFQPFVFSNQFAFAGRSSEDFHSWMRIFLVSNLAEWAKRYLSIFYRLPNFPFCVHLYFSIYALREIPIFQLDTDAVYSFTRWLK